VGGELLIAVKKAPSLARQLLQDAAPWPHYEKPTPAHRAPYLYCGSALAAGGSENASGAQGPRQAPRSGWWRSWAFMADVYWPYAGQPLEHRSVSMRIDAIEEPLGDGDHGPIHPQDHRVRGPGRGDRWSRRLPHV